MKIKMILLSLTIVSTGCFDLDLTPKKTMTFKGKVVEAYDQAKPIENVLVEGCMQKISLFPNFGWNCETKSYSNPNGDFIVSLKYEELTGFRINFDKDGYANLDSCLTLSDGSLICYMQPLETFFSIFSRSKFDGPFIYDSLIVNLQFPNQDTTVFYKTDFRKTSSGDKIHYWFNPSNTASEALKTYTIFKVLEDSYVGIDAEYFKEDSLVKVENLILFCPKGVGNSYEISSD